MRLIIFKIFFKSCPIKKNYFLLFYLLIAETSYSQDVLKPNTVYFEIGGNALFTSINYDRQIFKKAGPGIHAGIGIYGITPPYLTIPFGVNYLLKFKSSQTSIELGFGVSYSKADVALYAIVEHREPNYKNKNYWNYIPSLGYRRITRKNMMYRFSIAPVSNHNDFFTFLGFAMGKNF